MKRHKRQAKNPRIDLSLSGSKLSVSALCLVLGSCAIEEVVPVTWNFSFKCARDADRAELVGLQIGKGGCPLRNPVVYETVKPTWASPASRPQGLPAGIYSFQGTAWDADGQTIASHCESVEIPAAEVIELGLWSADGCGGNAELEDAGWEDSGSTLVDAGNSSQDAGDPPDAGSSPDAGGDCPDKSDRDADGVADCMDACPDDVAKVAAGQCGCGTSDVDGDGDGTSDCVDECPLDANKAVRGTCGCNVNNQLGPSETLTVGQYLCGPVDDSVRLTMGADGRLKLTVDDLQVWASTSAPTTGYVARLQGDGNLVIRPMGTTSVPNPPSVWDSGTVYKVNGTVVHGVSSLAVNANGTVTIASEGKVVWTVPQP